MTERVNRPYSSRLRDDQAQRTRDLILDALTELLSDHAAHEITTRAIAERAGVSQPTVYRHFPDRQALLEGLSDRITTIAEATGGFEMATTLDGLGPQAARDLALTDEHAALATAEALLNADPRRLSRQSRSRSDELHRMVAAELPGYSAHDHVRITALLRCLYSVQNWLRMREEFGLPGTESGPVLTWAFDTLLEEIRAGNFPRSTPPDESSS